MQKYRYVPRGEKEKLIYQICQLAPNYSIGDNMELLWHDEVDDLKHILKTLKSKR